MNDSRKHGRVTIALLLIVIAFIVLPWFEIIEQVFAINLQNNPS